MEKKPTPKSVRYTAYALFSTIILVVIVLAGEFYTRSNPEYGRAGFVFSKDLIYHLTPNLVAEKAYAWGKVNKPPFTLRFNKQGFRGADFRGYPEENTTRILVLGDSYTAGIDYPKEVTYVGQWENKLNEKGTKQFEILNVSCPAWGTDQQYLFWEKYGRDLHPDHVVIMMSPNDIRETWNHQVVRYDNASGEIQVHNPVEKIPTKERLSWDLAAKSSFFKCCKRKFSTLNTGIFSGYFGFFQ